MIPQMFLRHHQLWFYEKLFCRIPHSSPMTSPMKVNSLTGRRTQVTHARSWGLSYIRGNWQKESISCCLEMRIADIDDTLRRLNWTIPSRRIADYWRKKYAISYTHVINEIKSFDENEMLLIQTHSWLWVFTRCKTNTNSLYWMRKLKLWWKI